MPGDLIIGEVLLEFGTGAAIANPCGEIAEVEALRARLGRTEQTLKAPPQILRAKEKRLGVFCTSFNEADGGARRESGEQVFVAGRIEVLAAVQFQHVLSILRLEFRIASAGPSG